MVITGERGTLRVGYHRAAELARWTLTSQVEETLGGDPKQCTVQAVTTFIDAFWSTQAVFSLGLDMGGSWWVWDQAEVVGSIVRGIVEITVTGNPTARSTF